MGIWYFPKRIFHICVLYKGIYVYNIYRIQRKNMPSSQYSYKAVVSLYGMEKEFFAPSLNKLKDLLGVCHETVTRVANNDGEPVKGCRKNIRIFRVPKEPSPRRVSTQRDVPLCTFPNKEDSGLFV